ncbi:MAG: 1-deoxy-D-xylulose-5-phosphate reductoisomerase [Acidobacteriota bacterium]
MKKICILGSTGSIGRSVLEVVEKYHKNFKVIGLSAGENFELLIEQIKKFSPEIVSIRKKEHANEIKKYIKNNSVKVCWGEDSAKEVASYPDCDIVVSSIVGISGLLPTYEAIKSGKTVALANKESLVTAGPILMEEAKRKNAKIIPIDSEHNAIFQLLKNTERKEIKKTIITASGGPFLHHSLDEMSNVTVEEALTHPKWKMGKKISIDSASMMNKGLEIIEARWLFDLHPDQIEVYIHPQSIIHSLVEFIDGSIIAYLSQNDMKIPIQYALFYPKRPTSMIKRVNLEDLAPFEFYKVDPKKFPCLSLSIQALKEGESMPIVLNAANEIAVNLFLQRKIKFTYIPELIEKIMNNHKKEKIENIETVLKLDRWARAKSFEIAKKSGGIN